MKKTLVLSVVCMLVGIGGGWSIRRSQHPAINGSAKPASVSTLAGKESDPGLPLNQMAQTEAAPLLEKLKSDPNNADLITSIGNVYYDAQLYSIAIEYYGRALQLRPSDAAVRTDMATAYWYLRDADTAIAEFDKALTYAPNNPNTLFNLGLVKLQGKRDASGAIADWEKLLATNPNYEERDKVEQMMAEAKKQGRVEAESKSR
jgi:cytochrome c-type biogenesis protein CcmH/NrfG